jgi:hypothetical protein
VTTAISTQADPFHALRDAVARSRERARRRRFNELRQLLAELDGQRAAAVDELTELIRETARGGGT